MASIELQVIQGIGTYIREISATRGSNRIEMVLMESKDYERHSETIIIRPVHVAQHCKQERV
jgi:hypothetical protein